MTTIPKATFEPKLVSLKKQRQLLEDKIKRGEPVTEEEKQSLASQVEGFLLLLAEGYLV